MKIIFVATPLKSEPSDPSPTANVEFAKEVARSIALSGAAPFLPHLLYTQFLDDAKVNERQTGIECGLALMKKADEVWFLLPTWRTMLSTGMHVEWAAAGRLGKRRRLFRATNRLSGFEEDLGEPT